MSWEEEIRELRRRERLAHAMGGEAKVARQHEFNKLTVRERIDDEVATEAEAFERAKRFLSYLPSSVDELPPEAADPDEHLERIRARLNRLRSPFRSAEFFEIEEIIDPRDNRALLTRWATLARRVLTTRPAHFWYRP